MSMTAERKTEVIKEYATKDGDTGSPEVQVAILSERITNLTEHFKTPREGQPFAPRPDQDGRQRRRLLDYIKAKDSARYEDADRARWHAPLTVRRRHRRAVLHRGRCGSPCRMRRRSQADAATPALPALRPQMRVRSQHLADPARWPAAIRRRRPEGTIHMFNIHREEIEWGGRKLVLETGRIARQADGAVLATYGETVVLATVGRREGAEAGHRFLPADRQYQERPSPPARFPAAISSAKAVRPRRRR